MIRRDGSYLQCVFSSYCKKLSLSLKRLREERAKETEDISEAVTTKNFPILMTDTKLLIQEVQRTPSRINSKKSIPKHVLFKLQKIKDKNKISEEVRGK